MAARAMWKGVVNVGTASVPVKLYSAIVSHGIHFRLLHKTDKAPVKQQLVSAETDEPIEYADVRKAFPIARGRMVLLEKEELEELEPEESRDIDVTRFVDPADVDHRLYERPYYLGPDGNMKLYFAAVAALEKKKKEGIARWVMRDREYVGALRVENGYLMLITMRHAEEIIAADALKPPGGRELQAREVKMAEQLIESLHGPFDPTQYHDQYRERVMELIEMKVKGKKPKVVKFRAKKVKDDQLADALEASLVKTKRKAHG
ncbi:MAG TPA: Ku protein [Thermoanaerobaculia bacterium]|jgi:DNA end-binding protein Ku|nr:Ku protein [Thermoanaerobaculia bacterium]